MKTLLSLQYLRAIAAFLVLLLHVSKLRFGSGMFGVDIFFVISGFIMWVTTHYEAVTPGAFFLRRFLRIAPLYWSVTLWAAFVSFNPNPAIGLEVSPAWLLQSLFFIAGDGQARDLGTPYAFLFPVLGVGWTLNFEMMFYALFALALSFKPALRLGTIMAALSALVALGFFVDEKSGIAIDFYTRSISIEFAFGVALGAAYTFSRGKGVEWNAPRIGAGLVILGAVLTRYGMQRLEIRGFALGPPALMICGGALLLEPLLRRRPSRTFKLLGDASYSLYLTHWPVLAAARRALPEVWFGELQWVRSVLLVLIALAAGVAAYRFYERPLTRTLARAFSRKPSLAPKPQTTL